LNVPLRDAHTPPKKLPTLLIALFIQDWQNIMP
jgi:hypothetical protein